MGIEEVPMAAWSREALDNLPLLVVTAIAVLGVASFVSVLLG